MTRTHEWQVPVDQCDVSDKVGLTRFRELADVWIKALDTDDENSVTTQVLDMMWMDAAWRSMNEARRLTIGDEQVGTPGMAAVLLDRGYIAGQVIAIGRLLDPSASQPKRQVNSIRRLVDGIVANRHLFTREIYVSRDGLPYDYREVRSRELSSMVGTDVQWLPTSGGLAWHQSSLQHRQFDRLAGVAPESRSRDDTISDAFFDRMKAAFEDQVFSDILEMRHKSIAHAADDFSRGMAKNLRSGLSLDEFARAHYLLLGLYQTISANLLYHSWLTDAVRLPLCDLFEGFDKPLVAERKIEELHRFWEAHGKERNGWMHKAYHEFVPM